MLSHNYLRSGLAISLVLSACGGPEAIPGTALSFEPSEGEFWGSPFPGEHRRREDGGVSLSGLPNPKRIGFVRSLRRLLEQDANGFGTTSTLYFPSEGPIDESSLPTLAESTEPGASVFLLDADPASPERGRRLPVRVAFLGDPGPFGAPNLLAVQPLQGVPLREGNLYAAVATRAVRDAAGDALGVPESTRRLIEGDSVEGLSGAARAAFDRSLQAVADAGMDVDQVAGITAFVTGTPSETFMRFVEATESEAPLLPVNEMEAKEVFDDFCVYEGRLQIPDYQAGTPPYSEFGGGWSVDALGQPQPQRRAESRLVLTIPRQPMPADGFPLVVFIRTGGGGDRPLVDRGVRARPGGPAVNEGTGPAFEFARAGYAGLSWDGPHGGLRNPTRGDEQFLVFNFENPEALRDNVRQSALEAVLIAKSVPSMTLTTTTCSGVSPGTIRFDPTKLALMGHSMGGTIAPIAFSAAPEFRALILSGAGGSWIENVIFKESPIAVRPIAEILLEYRDEGRTLEPFDPALALLQWAGESADPPVYAKLPFRGRADGAGPLPRHVLMMQGITDTYIPPSIANALSLAAQLDLAGSPLEESLTGLLPLVGQTTTDLPASGNGMDGSVTRIVTQHRQGPIEDGHEVVFQTEAPKRQYRCFLQDIDEGRVPEVPSPSADGTAPCR